MNADEHSLNALTKQVIGCAFHVSNKLACVYLEKVYRNALERCLRKAGLTVETEVPLSVVYEGAVVGEFYADLIVEGIVLVELKAVRELDELHWAQCLNYLKACQLPVCLLINFGGTKVQIKRFRSQQGGSQ